MAKWYKENKLKINAQHAEYRKDNSEKENKRHAKYFQENKKKVYEYRKRYAKINPNIKISIKYRQKVIDIIKMKKNKYYDIIGCTSEFLFEWIYFNAEDYMTSSNYGTEWHIDHVIPCRLFCLSNEEEAKKCFNWKNMRPLSKHENLSKNGKLNHTDIEQQNSNIIMFYALKEQEQEDGICTCEYLGKTLDYKFLAFEDSKMVSDNLSPNNESSTITLSIENSTNGETPQLREVPKDATTAAPSESL
jgi:hypothetical protein